MDSKLIFACLLLSSWFVGSFAGSYACDVCVYDKCCGFCPAVPSSNYKNRTYTCTKKNSCQEDTSYCPDYRDCCGTTCCRNLLECAQTRKTETLLAEMTCCRRGSLCGLADEYCCRSQELCINNECRPGTYLAGLLIAAVGTFLQLAIHGISYITTAQVLQERKTMYVPASDHVPVMLATVAYLGGAMVVLYKLCWIGNELTYSIGIAMGIGGYVAGIVEAFFVNTDAKTYAKNLYTFQGYRDHALVLKAMQPRIGIMTLVTHWKDKRTGEWNLTTPSNPPPDRPPQKLYVFNYAYKDLTENIEMNTKCEMTQVGVNWKVEAGDEFTKQGVAAMKADVVRTLTNTETILAVEPVQEVAVGARRLIRLNKTEVPTMLVGNGAVYWLLSLIGFSATWRHWLRRSCDTQVITIRKKFYLSSSPSLRGTDPKHWKWSIPRDDNLVALPRGWKPPAHPPPA